MLKRSIQKWHCCSTLLLAALFLPAEAFRFLGTQQTKATTVRYHYNTALFSETQTFSAIDSSADGEDEDVNGGSPNLTGSLTDARWYEFELKNHKPLGCSVEESLASEPDGVNYVFVSEVR